MIVLQFANGITRGSFFKMASLTLFSLFVSSIIYAQGIGFAAAIDGGFEKQANSGAAAVFQSAPSEYYTVNNSGSVLTFLSAGGRSGSKYVSWTVSGSSSNGFYTPSDVSNAIAGSSSYVVQFYYRNSSSSNSKSFNISVSPDGINAFGSAVNTGTLVQTSWTKVTAVVTSGSSGSNQNGIIRFVPNSTFSNPFYLDDIVVYPGTAVDASAPDNVANPAISNVSNNALTVQWDAPSTGIDGGGYMVVRYTTDPSSSIAPVQNGVYAVGNTIGNGSVVYVGTSTSFVDNALGINANYYYRIYTVDKAFNYSSPQVVNATTTNNSSVKNLTVTNKVLLATLGDSVGIGTTTPSQKLDVNGNIKSSGKIIIGDIDTSKIGEYALAVNGTAVFTKAKVKLYSKWPDYVFDKEYDLPNLKYLESYIQEHKHLPGVISAKEAEEKGIDLGNTQGVLLKKIEELTLYLIQQNKLIEQLQAEINLLKSSK